MRCAGRRLRDLEQWLLLIVGRIRRRQRHAIARRRNARVRDMPLQRPRRLAADRPRRRPADMPVRRPRPARPPLVRREQPRHAEIASIGGREQVVLRVPISCRSAKAARQDGLSAGVSDVAARGPRTNVRVEHRLGPAVRRDDERGQMIGHRCVVRRCAGTVSAATEES